MDEYVSKPIRSTELCEKIAAVVENGRPTSSPPEPPAELEAQGAIDLAAALDAVQGDRELLAEVAAAFLEEGPRLVVEISQAIERSQPLQLKHAAHTLKGAVRYFGAQDAFDLALALEGLGASGQLDGAQQLSQQLSDRIERMTRAIGRLSHEGYSQAHT